jgi:hypothetical protein
MDPIGSTARVGGHVLKADDIVKTAARTAHGCYYIVSWLVFANFRPNFFDPAEALMTDDQVIVPVRSRSILGRDYFFIRTVNPDAQNLHEHASAVGNVMDRRLRNVS